jgi:hypothetical protein
MKRLCHICNIKPAKRMKSRIGFVKVLANEAFFCSMRCAADYGLLIAETSEVCSLHWCEKHGWHGTECDGNCPECLVQITVNEG